MTALTLQRVPDAARAAATSRPVPEVLVQRASTLGPAASLVAPAIRDMGRPLDATTRGAMESSFGRDLSSVRVHDDARAHDSARDLGARAYTAGEDIVFAEGAYRPDTPRGQALIAHELAHTVHQGGVQLKSMGELPANADHELEAQADRAALDVTSGRPAPALSALRRPVIFRADGDPPAGGSTQPAAAGPTQRLPPGMVALKDDPPGVGTNLLVVGVTDFKMPAEKGFGPWVKAAFDEAQAGKKLVFSPIIEGEQISSFKEGSKTAEYRSIWLRNFGFTSTSGLAAAFQASKDDRAKAALTDPSVAKLVKGLGTGLQASGCDIDHIIEKQIGGTSLPSNLQLLDSKKNNASGTQTQQALVQLVKAIRDPSMRGKGVRNLQLHLLTVGLTPATSDPSFVVEDLLRSGAVKGKDEVKAKAEGTPVSLSAGGQGETVRIQETGRTLIDSMEARIVPGARLTAYTRGPGGPKSKADLVEGALDSLAVKRTGEKAGLTLTAVPAPAGTKIGAGAGGVAAEENLAASEVRVLQLSAADKKRRIAFFYPYLSPGFLSEVGLDEKGQLFGTGILKPSVPFLGDLKIAYGPGPDKLSMTSDIPAAKLRVPIQGFRFTGGSLELALFPTFIPKGNLTFEIGPSARPVILGDLKATSEGGAFVATGDLRPGGKVPGIKEATGKVRYHSETGWDGKLTATGSPFAGATLDATLGFRTNKAGKFDPYASGGIEATIKGGTISLRADWDGQDVSYYGGGKISDPLPLVKEVKLKGRYAGGVLFLEGTAPVEWRNIAATAKVAYRRRDGDEGKFSGSVEVTVKTEKAEGVVLLVLREDAKVTGKGSIKYWVTKNLRPELGIELLEKDRVRIFGSAEIGTVPLLPKWPSAEGGHITFLKAGLKFKFPIPAVPPPTTGLGEVYAEAFLAYGVGPVALVGVTLKGELFPFEDDPKFKGDLSGKLAVPGYATLGGKLGANIGVEVALGALGAKGGIAVRPSLTVKGEVAAPFKATYAAGAFSFSADAEATGTLVGTVAVDLLATMSAAWGLLTHTWTWNIANKTKSLEPGLKVSFGKFSYGKGGEVSVEPNVKAVPENLDTIGFLQGLLGDAKDKEKKIEPPKPIRSEDDYYRYHGHMI